MTSPRSRPLQFQEIEHKFEVADDFDLDGFAAALEALGPSRQTAIRVTDTYYLTSSGRAGGFVIRHRYDEELHHLTLKTLEADTEVRQEINLDLGHHAGNQQARVDAFLEHFGVEWRGSLEKELRVWYFPDAEIVHYRATTEDGSAHCVEFEATEKPTLAAALATVRRYESATGFDEADRSHRPLVEILFPELGALLR